MRDIRDDIPIGVFLMVGAGDHPRLTALRDAIGGGLMGSLVGEPEAVADVVRSLADDGISRVQLTPYTPATIELLAPHLAEPGPRARPSGPSRPTDDLRSRRVRGRRCGGRP